MGGRDERPSWDEYFMRIAHEVAKRATCLRRSIGAVVVLDKRILATGYNGAPSGLPHCSETGCLREKRPQRAEARAVPGPARGDERPAPGRPARHPHGRRHAL